MQIEQKPADGRCGQSTVSHQVVPVVVAQFHCVLLEGVNKVDAVANRHAGIFAALSDGIGFLQVGIAHHVAGQGLFKAVEPAQLVLRRQFAVIGDIVRRPGQVIENRNMRPKFPGQQKRPDGKILIPRSLAGGYFDIASRCLVHSDGLPVKSVPTTVRASGPSIRLPGPPSGARPIPWS